MRVNPNIAPDLLNNLNQIELQQQQAEIQLSTGRRVNMPSDDPAAAAADVEDQAEQSITDQYLQNTSSLEGLLQTADSTLSSVVTSLNQAVSLGTEGANGDLSASDRQTITQQVQGIQQSVLQLANVSYQGSYIFSGTKSTTPPFALDPTQADGVVYNGNTATNNVQIADGRSIQINLPGSQVFQGAGGDIFGALQQLVTALQSGNTTNIGAATTQVSTALNYLSDQRVFYGNAVDQLNSNQSFLQQEQVNLQSEDNTLVGANMAQVSTNLAQTQTAQSAALAALARVIPQSLLDYLK